MSTLIITLQTMGNGTAGDLEAEAGRQYSPVTGTIASLGLYDCSRGEGVVYYQGGTEQAVYTEGEWRYKERSEAILLQEFWEGIASYDTVVTFNGRAFLLPFVLHRSVVQKVRPTVDLLRKRYLRQQTLPFHIDLYDELTFYGALERRVKLQTWCQLYGIENPPDYLSPEEMRGLQQEGEFMQIARHTASLTTATDALFQIWKQYLAPASFLNTIEF